MSHYRWIRRLAVLLYRPQVNGTTSVRHSCSWKGCRNETNRSYDLYRIADFSRHYHLFHRAKLVYNMGKRNIIHKLFHNLKKPEGFWGRVILREMNKRHTLLSEWGMSHIVWNKEWNVLDIGCGGGANLTQLMHRCPQGKAYGIDISPESVLFAQKKNKKYLSTRCFIEQGTVDTLPYTDEMFDVVTAFETVYFWNDLPKAFTEVTRVLKRNGHFLICCELNNLSVKTWTNLIDGMIIRSCDELKSILLQSGFVSIASYKHEKGPLCIVARRRAE